MSIAKREEWRLFITFVDRRIISSAPVIICGSLGTARAHFHRLACRAPLTDVNITHTRTHTLTGARTHIHSEGREREANEGAGGRGRAQRRPGDGKRGPAATCKPDKSSCVARATDPARLETAKVHTSKRTGELFVQRKGA